MISNGYFSLFNCKTKSYERYFNIYIYVKYILYKYIVFIKTYWGPIFHPITLHQLSQHGIFSEFISFAVFSDCSWEAISPVNSVMTWLNWLTKIMMLPVLSLDIRGPSVLCLSLYTSTTFIERYPGWSSG